MFGFAVAVHPKGAYDLVLRHALDVDDEGRTLAFGSTMGALWVSENGGDDRRLVNAPLHSIHAVRCV